MTFKNKFILVFSVYNSYQNLEIIFLNIKNSNFNNLIKNIIIIDNNSDLKNKDKIKLIKYLSKKFKKKIKLIINQKNYGIGGSQKILFNYLKNEKFDFFINAHTSGRYKILDQLKYLNKIDKFEYIVGSRFSNKKDTKDYSLIRKIANIFFQKLTSLVSSNKLTDPGNAIYFMSNKLLKKIFNESYNLTNYSHFNHLLNVMIQSKTSKIYEFPLKWKDGNIKSHLNPTMYILVLSLSLLKFSLTGNFFKEKKKKFLYRRYFFKN